MSCFSAFAEDFLAPCLELLQGFQHVVNATMFDRYGAADDFLDSQEIKHVY
ncbi:hypothetical protein AB9F19_12190 [Escherichia coli]|uniref:hypothetical protein n=1 Tax=Escherichia coli TaxID=562 RepID=UPI0038B43427